MINDCPSDTDCPVWSSSPTRCLLEGREWRFVKISNANKKSLLALIFAFARPMEWKENRPNEQSRPKSIQKFFFIPFRANYRVSFDRFVARQKLTSEKENSSRMNYQSLSQERFGALCVSTCAPFVRIIHSRTDCAARLTRNGLATCNSPARKASTGTDG